MRTVAILQPTYLPWLGYFDIIDQADTVVLLDTVPIAKQSWQTRNRILNRNGNTQWLTIPIHATLGQQLSTVTIAANQPWQAKHLRAIQHAYQRTSHYRNLDAVLSELRHWRWTNLSRLNATLINVLALNLGIATDIVRASQLDGDQPLGRIERIHWLLEKTRGEEFLEPAGGEKLFGHSINSIPIRYHNYNHPEYQQDGAPFVSHLSAIDALTRLGPKATLELIRSGRQKTGGTQTEQPWAPIDGDTAATGTTTPAEALRS